MYKKLCVRPDQTDEPNFNTLGDTRSGPDGFLRPRPSEHLYMPFIINWRMVTGNSLRARALNNGHKHSVALQPIAAKTIFALKTEMFLPPKTRPYKYPNVSLSKSFEKVVDKRQTDITTNGASRIEKGICSFLLIRRRFIDQPAIRMDSRDSSEPRLRSILKEACTRDVYFYLAGRIIKNQWANDARATENYLRQPQFQFCFCFVTTGGFT